MKILNFVCLIYDKRTMIIYTVLRMQLGHVFGHAPRLILPHNSWTSYFTLVCLWCGWTARQVGRTSRDYQNFSDRQITKFSCPWCSASRAWSSAKKKILAKKIISTAQTWTCGAKKISFVAGKTPPKIYHFSFFLEMKIGPS